MKIYLVVLNYENDGHYEDYVHDTLIISVHSSKEKALDVIRNFRFDNCRRLYGHFCNDRVIKDNIDEEKGERNVMTNGDDYDRWFGWLRCKEMEFDKEYYL